MRLKKPFRRLEMNLEMNDLVKLTEAINNTTNPQTRDKLLNVLEATISHILSELQHQNSEKKHKCCQAKHKQQKQEQEV